MNTVVILIITSLIVSILWSKFFMKQLEKWMDCFFEEETKRIKKMLD